MESDVSIPCATAQAHRRHSGNVDKGGKMFQLPHRDRSTRIAFVVLVHATLLWCALKLDRPPVWGSSQPGAPAMVWINAAVAALGPQAEMHDPAPAPAAMPPQANAPLAESGPAPVLAAVPVTAPERVVMPAAAPSNMPVPASELAPAAPENTAGNARPAATASGSSPAGSSADAASDAASVPAPTASVPGSSKVAAQAKAIEINIVNTSVAKYTVPGLTGQQVHVVNRGTYPSIQAAVVHDVVVRIRASYPKSIIWERIRGGGFVQLSMEVEDQVDIETFLLGDMFGLKPLSNGL